MPATHQHLSETHEKLSQAGMKPSRVTQEIANKLAAKLFPRKK